MEPFWGKEFAMWDRGYLLPPLKKTNKFVEVKKLVLFPSKIRLTDSEVEKYFFLEGVFSNGKIKLCYSSNKKNISQKYMVEKIFEFGKKTLILLLFDIERLTQWNRKKLLCERQMREIFQVRKNACPWGRRRGKFVFSIQTPRAGIWIWIACPRKCA